MTCGIYKLDFNGICVYIGQSIDIETRYSTHLRLLRSGNHTKQLLDAYNKYGLPRLKILKECHKHYLDTLESVYISAQRLPVVNTAKIPIIHSRAARKALKHAVDVSTSPLETYINNLT